MDDAQRKKLLLIRAFYHKKDLSHLSLDATKTGNRIRAIRKWFNLSQEEFCSMLSDLTGVTISRQQYNKWEAGSIPKDMGILAQIAYIGGTTVDWLITGVDYRLFPDKAPDAPYPKVYAVPDYSNSEWREFEKQYIKG